MKTTIDPQLLLQVTHPIGPQQTKTAKDRAALKKSCQDFEALFVQSMFKAMRKTVPEGGLFAKSNATKIFEEMVDQEITAGIAKNQSTGLAEQIYRQLEKNCPRNPDRFCPF